MSILFRALARGLLGLVVALALLYLADFVVWRIRVARGGGMDTVQVTRTVVAPLKGNREEYYPDGVEQVDCSQSIFQQSGSGACWYLRRHRSIEER